MKKIILSLVFAIVSIGSFGQIIKAKELESYAKEKYGSSWEEAAKNLSDQLTLNKNNGITYVKIIQADGQSKNQLYVVLNYWFTATFNDANSVIKLNDKEVGTIIAQGYVEGIANHAGGMNRYNVNIRPIIKCDIKDNKVRVSYTIPFYSVDQYIGGGSFATISGAVPTKVDTNWTLDECYPFVQKDKHKKTSSKALVMAHAYSNIIIDKIEEAIKNGLTGNENDEW